MGRSIASVQRVIDFLTDATVGPGMAPATAAQVASSSPMLLIGTRDPARQLAPLVVFLRELGVDPAADACLGFYAWPDAMNTIEHTANFLRNECGFSVDDLRANVSLLGYDLHNRVRPRTLY